MELRSLHLLLFSLSLISHVCSGQTQEKLKPVLSVAPDGPLTFLGGSVILTCVLLELNVTFRWFCDAAEVHRSQHNQFIIADVQKSHSCSYRCYGSFEHWPRFSFWSNAVNLTVIQRPKALVSVTAAGNTVTLTCDIQPSGNTNWTFIWFKDASVVPVHTEREITVTPDASHTGNYSCRGETRPDPLRSDMSDAVTLTTGLSGSEASLSVLKLLSFLLAVCPYLLASVMLALRCCRSHARPDGENDPVCCYREDGQST
ncbi:uncharacterized protein LOC131541478 [Onychostoma macrolepis]|uniref:Ig-like domain-containing protein n=1 Tax=Onychostoma macrolepis TaxID=369639 RepID=A0A7J6D406_9TELE|nr:uncharacterized protein LOC131540552 [Onychostoma macrolepis]XP_058633219.1 uncharacterized protein LOC131541478 [Onychostoma macrolepis]KAF4113960.1 hypothetical protein G5714_006505 [Onychostoma macrolepis]